MRGCSSSAPRSPAATCWTLAWLGYAAWDSPWGAAVAVLVCAPLLAPPDVWFLTLPLLVVLIELPAGHRAPVGLRAALGAAVGLVSLIKFTFLLAALAVLVPLTAASLLARHRVPVAAGARCCRGRAWFAAGQTRGRRRAVPRLVAARYLGRLPECHAVAGRSATGPACGWGEPGGVRPPARCSCSRRLRSGRAAAMVALRRCAVSALQGRFRARRRAYVHHRVRIVGHRAAARAAVGSPAGAPGGGGGTGAAAAGAAVGAHGRGRRCRPIMYYPPVFPYRAIARLAAAPRVLGGDALARAHAAQRGRHPRREPAAGADAVR